MLGQYLLRKGAGELDVWRRREETMRPLRWAAEHAVSADAGRARLGVAALTALRCSELVQPADEALVETVTDVVLRTNAGSLQGPAAEMGVDVVLLPGGTGYETLSSDGVGSGPERERS